jgi:hypothetical protein
VDRLRPGQGLDAAPGRNPDRCAALGLRRICVVSGTQLGVLKVDWAGKQRVKKLNYM